ncbi:mediator complex subunit 13 C-terminal-domain-containing protein [Halteromyces radiatus]|uniref:mediator complex subunit 13 C-terminal-domain-containing protein n=1 Tax=Halteromyces radiatus TaxID=101107 RepID=UPI00221F4B93|nr:mediator complex subunit 13 C-terminal-domain-containing protein [Halteromyces radiatus]KAI8096464.1 mediator complex subunit 13 C-terminal-domain-containing protein [Halteromyces radiatus]
MDTQSETITLELWVFWFDDRHTGLIDANLLLRELDELRVGSFTWENVSSKNTHRSNACTLVTVVMEYKLFIKAIRNLILPYMLKKDALPLGEFFVFPPSYLEPAVGEDCDTNPSSLLCCTYNIYLASTNLVFQPNTRRIRLRPLTSSDLNSKAKVLLSPTGEQALLDPSRRHTITHSYEDRLLKQWAALLQLPISQLISNNMPSLVLICMSYGEKVYYPSRLVFMITPTRQSPSALAGMNGTMGYNHGLTEDIAQKWNREMWLEQVLANQADKSRYRVDYWTYTNPRLHTTLAALDSLSTSTLNTPNSTDANSPLMIQGGVLIKALSEPVLSSPLMASKSVATPSSPLPRDDDTTASMMMTPQQHHQQDTLIMPPTNNMMQAHSQQQSSYTHSTPTHMMSNANYTSPLQMSYTASPQQPVPGQQPMYDQQQQLQLQQQQQQQLQQQQLQQQHQQPQQHIKSGQNLAINDGMNGGSTMDMNSIDVLDTMVYDMSTPWGGDGGLDNLELDLDVTEEDFNFFESEPAKPTTTTTTNMPTETAMADIQSLDFFQVNPEDSLQTNAVLDSLDFPQTDPVSTTDTTTGLDELMTSANYDGMILDTPKQEINQSVDMVVDSSPMPMDGTNTIVKQEPQDEGKISKQRLVPPSFAPLSLSTIVNDAKYMEGGKFTYVPEDDDMTTTLRKQKDRTYRPDYVPIIKKKRNKKKVDDEQDITRSTVTGKNQTMEKSSTPTHLLDKDGDHDMMNTTLSNNIDTISDSNSISSSSDSSDSGNMDDGISTSDNGSRAMEMDYADDDVDDDDDGLWLEKLGKARTIYLHRLVGDVKVVHGGKRRYLLDRLHLDYDTPFATTVTPGLVRPDRYHEEDDRPLHYLCQQAVLGGYPFTGGLAEISTNGGEVALGESTRIMIARRRDLITVTDEPLPLSVTDFTSSVSVNGPLNVQQYYELSESNQIHSKYGKYQVKKRRPAEPNFDTLHSPDIVVSRHDEFIEGSPKMIDFWEKLRLEPYSAKKNISYFAVCPNNDELESAVQVFFKGLSTVYEACCLGAHHPGHIGPYRRGTVPVTLLPEEQGQSKRERQLKSYMATCEQLGTSLGGVMAENVYIVIYMVNPYPHLSSHLDLSKCYDRLMNAFEQARLQHTNTSIISGTTATSRLPSEKTRARLVMQLVPIEHIVRCTDFGSYTKNGLKEIAFSVYSKCPTIVNNHVKINVEEEITTPNTAEIYAPPFVLTKQIPENITYSLTPSLNAPVLLDQDATLHLAYGYSLDRRWMVVVWTDHRGELVEFAVLRASARQSAPFVTVFEEAWKRTLEIAGQTDFMWTFVIVKMGLMFENELQAWIHVLPENEKTAVISMDMESSLHVDALVGQEEPIPYFAPDTPQTPQTPNVGPNHVSTPPPTPQQASSSSPGNKNNISSMDMVDTTTNTTMTKILLLNHRVAYSRKRQRVSEGVTLMDAISDPESWILPLASGYLVQLPKQGSPTAASEEQFGRAPCVVELHLIYNQTQHSSYTTLRDIIKQYYALSYVNIIPSSYNCLPLHVVLADRLWRLLLVVDY